MIQSSRLAGAACFPWLGPGGTQLGEPTWSALRLRLWPARESKIEDVVHGPGLVWSGGLASGRDWSGGLV